MDTPEIPVTTADAESFSAHKAIRNGEKVTATAQPRQDIDTSAPEEGESVSATETEKHEAQEQTPAKRDRTANGRAEELFRQGRYKEATDIIRAAAAKEHKERADRLEEELQQHRTRKPAEPGPAQSKPPAATGDPEPQSGDEKYQKENGYEQYLIDRARHGFRQEQREQAEAARQATVKDSLTRKVQAAKAKYEDFDAVTAGDMASGQGLILTPAMIQFMQESDEGLDVVYHLGKDPDDYKRIAVMSPGRQIVELAKIEARLAAPLATPERPKAAPVSRTAPPPRTVGGTEAPAAKSTAEATSMAEHRRLRSLQTR